MTPKKQKVLDRLLDMELVSSPDEALAHVLSGNVVSDKQRFSSLHDTVDADEIIRLKNQKKLFVSRGGDKLASVFDQFGFSLENQTGLDSGASTGGFTDFCLQHGAAAMIAVDVSYGMLAHSLRTDPRVTTIERTNVKTLSLEKLATLLLNVNKKGQCKIELPVDFVVGDLSFIALRHVLPALLSVLKPGGWMILLIKPQFEATQDQLPVGGVITDTALQEKIVASVEASCAHLSIQTTAIIASGLKGREGNQEYFWGLRKTLDAIPLPAHGGTPP